MLADRGFKLEHREEHGCRRERRGTPQALPRIRRPRARRVRPRRAPRHGARTARPERRGQDHRRPHPRHACCAPTAGAPRSTASTLATQAADVRRRIGLVGQYAALDEILDGRGNLVMFGRLFHLSRHDAQRRADELLARFDLTDAGRRPVGNYSGGMRRRLDLAVSMILTPAVLFLDEPTTGLDPRGRAEVWARGARARRRRHHGAAHHPVPGRGRPARRPDLGAGRAEGRRRPRGRRGHARRAAGADRWRPDRPRRPARRRPAARRGTRGAGGRRRRPRSTRRPGAWRPR